MNDRFAELNIYYKKTVELTSNFIALVESEEAVFYKELLDTPTYGLIFSKLTAGFSGFSTYIGMKFAPIPAGTFMMGSPSSEDGRRSDECPQHQVTISQAFEMGVTEVTRDQWQAVMGSYPDNNTRHDGQLCQPTVKEDNHPVSCVSWHDVQAFIAKLNQLDASYHYRLPTEAEWEYAARAGTTGKYSVDGPLESFAWYDGNSGGQTHPVAQLKANGFGLYDMHGNVWEWTADWYDENYYSKSPSVDPKGPSTGSDRVSRGGSWNYNTQDARVATRGSNGPTRLYSSVGLRLLRTPQ